MMKLLQNKKAVSPVVSAMIMVVIVMVGMSAAFAFIINYKQDFQSGSGSAVYESMTVEDVWFRNTEVAEVWIYNFGKVSIEIVNVYINNDAVPFTFTAPSEDPNIAIEGHCKLSVFLPTQFVQGESYTFKIVTARGTSFEGVYTWPW
jgi:FlaG/FlaF family flagellin (archaellin)